MLLNSHNLDAVVAILDDSWQHILTEFCIGTHFLGILRHTDMALVDEKRVDISLEFLFLPLIWGLRIPHLC